MPPAPLPNAGSLRILLARSPSALPIAPRPAEPDLQCVPPLTCQPCTGTINEHSDRIIVLASIGGIARVARVIAIANQKGGSGKTTTTRSLAAALAERGRQVLMIDLDPQASLSEGCGVELHKVELSTYHVLIGTAKLIDVILEVEERIGLAPTNIHLSAAELQLVNM